MHKFFLTILLSILAVPAFADSMEKNFDHGKAMVQEIGYSVDSHEGLATSSQILKKLKIKKTDSEFFVSPNIDLSIHFKPGSAELTEDSYTQIFELAEALNHPDLLYLPFAIEGHTDSNGDNASNKALSERRAMAVKNALKNKYDVNTSKISAVGYGESKPVADNHTAEGRAQNRRVTIVRVG